MENVHSISQNHTVLKAQFLLMVIPNIVDVHLKTVVEFASDVLKKEIQSLKKLLQTNGLYLTILISLISMGLTSTLKFVIKFRQLNIYSNIFIKVLIE